MPAGYLDSQFNWDYFDHCTCLFFLTGCFIFFNWPITQSLDNWEKFKEAINFYNKVLSMTRIVNCFVFTWGYECFSYFRLILVLLHIVDYEILMAMHSAHVIYHYGRKIITYQYTKQRRYCSNQEKMW